MAVSQRLVQLLTICLPEDHSRRLPTRPQKDPRMFSGAPGNFQDIQQQLYRGVDLRAWNEIQGQRQKIDNKDRGRPEAAPRIIIICLLVLTFDFNLGSKINPSYSCCCISLFCQMCLPEDDPKY